MDNQERLECGMSLVLRQKLVKCNYNDLLLQWIQYILRFKPVAASPDQIKSQRNYCPFFP